MFDDNRFICVINNCLIDEENRFNEHYQTLCKQKVENQNLRNTDNEFFATLMENLVSKNNKIIFLIRFN